MKIDWKVVSQSMGYRKLKDALLHSIKRRDRSKKELHKHFQWIIGRATHYAYHKNTTVDVILDQWETVRNSWWYGYYQDSRQPKLNQSTLVCRPSVRTYFKKDSWYRDPVKKKHAVLRHIMHKQKEAAKKTGRKARWDTERKQREARHRKYLAEKSAKSSP